MKKLIYLCYAPINLTYLGTTTNFAPSVGLMSIKTTLERHTSHSVKYIDGIFVKTEEIIKKIEQDKPNVVGVSSLLISYDNSLKILKSAKSAGATTVMGGHHATHLAKNIVNNNDYIDFVVRGYVKNYRRSIKYSSQS